MILNPAYPVLCPGFYNIGEDRLGMIITSGTVTLKKDDTNLIGISIGGGAPFCPCLYVVQVFDNTSAGIDGTLESGDELVSVNGLSVRGRTKVQVLNMIQNSNPQVTLNYNKLHADPREGKSLDIILKKLKHRLVENCSTSITNTIGMSRAILSNDMLVMKLKGLKETEVMYIGLIEQIKKLFRSLYHLLEVYKEFGDIFAKIGVHEPQPRASETFVQFGDIHRQMYKFGLFMLQHVKSILPNLGTYLYKAIPDTKLTIRKYADTKFEYLSYCLKVKEMDDEEYESYNSFSEPLYRVETGNYEYRLILRCRQDARDRFSQLRSDVLVKLELLDNKHVQHIVWQLMKLIVGFNEFHGKTLELLKSSSLFPIEIDLSCSSFQQDLFNYLEETSSDEDYDVFSLDEDKNNMEESLVFDKEVENDLSELTVDSNDNDDDEELLQVSEVESVGSEASNEDEDKKRK